MEVTIMTGKRYIKIIFALVVIVIVAFGSVALYRLGFAHGAMTNITISEGGDLSMLPYGRYPMGWHYGPRMGLLGFFPLLCFGGFFFLFLLFGFGFITRKRAWMHPHGSGSHPKNWEHYGSPPWGAGERSQEENQPAADSESPSEKKD
jgi:hypothetical protein